MARPAAGQDLAPAARVRAAIEEAVQERLGGGALVAAEVLDVRLGEASGGIAAWPEQGARAGVAARFSLFTSDSRRVRIGEATAIVSATVEAVRLTRPVGRGEAIGRDDIERVRVAHTGVLIGLPTPDEVLGAHARRDLAAGATVAKSDVIPEPAVRSGDTVKVVVRIAGVEVSTTAVALQSGARSEVIRLTNPASRKALLGRVIRRGEVEVVDVY
jgi:flagella basal body P-ring formation protein FlgA